MVKNGPGTPENELLTVQASYTQIQLERGRRARLIENENGLAELVVQQNIGGELSETDSLRLRLHWLDVVDTWEWQYRESQAGRLPETVLNIEDWRGQLESFPGARATYERTKPRRDEGFLQFMEERVLQPDPVGPSEN